MRQPKTAAGRARVKARAGSNNADNPNQNHCALAVAKAFGCGDAQRYLHTIEDVKRAVGSRYSVRSVKSKVNAATAGGARKGCASVADAIGFIVWVPGHVLAFDHSGKTVVDTAPKSRDRRKLLGIWGVYPK